MAHWSALGVILVVACSLLSVGYGHKRPTKAAGSAGERPGECRVVADSFTAFNLGPASLVPKERVHDPSLDVCVAGHGGTQHKSCCNKAMENTFTRQAELDFYDVIKSTSAALKDTLAIHAVFYQDDKRCLAERRDKIINGGDPGTPVLGRGQKRTNRTLAMDTSSQETSKKSRKDDPRSSNSGASAVSKQARLTTVSSPRSTLERDRGRSTQEVPSRQSDEIKELRQQIKELTGEFLRMLAAAENRTNVLLGDVYKIPTQDRHSPLNALFTDLQAYVRRRHVNVHDSVEKFFDELFPLVYHNLLNDPSVTTLDEDFRECLTESRQQLNPRPFGDVPHRLSHTLSQALFSARTFLEALHIGVDAINTTEKVALEPQCVKTIARLRYCGQCGGHIGARPCRNFCYNVMRGCLATSAEIDRHWNEFVDSIKTLTVYMQGSYNIEEVLRGLHTRVSEAIMHSMETGHKFYAKLIERCGHPKASKKGKHTPGLQPIPGVSGGNKSSQEVPPSETSALDNARMEAFMRSIMASKGFYHNMADTVCSHEKFATGQPDQDHCWNGHSLGRYNKTLVAVDLEIQMSSNPEMKVTARRNNNIVALIDRLIHVKKLLGSKLSRDMMQADQRPFKSRSRGYQRISYSGDGGTQIDDEDYNNDFSGSGDGIYVGGSGSGPTYEQPHSRNKPSSGNPGGPGDDIYIVDEPSQKPPTYNGITQRPPGAQGSTSTAAPSTYVTSTSVVLMTSLLTSLVGSVLWLNG